MISRGDSQEIESLWGTLRETDAETTTIVNPPERLLKTLVESTELTDYPFIRILATRSDLRPIMSEFFIASRTADIIATDSVSIRVVDTPMASSFCIDPNRLIALLAIDDAVTTVESTDDDRFEAVYETVLNRWDEAESYTVDTPEWSRVTDRMADIVSESVRDDFATILSSLNSRPRDETRINEVTASLLAAANNGALLYDLSQWGETTSVASKATFSRAKGRLEDANLIETEKVPIDVGRPRLRLTFPDTIETEPYPDKLLSEVERTLSTSS